MKTLLVLLIGLVIGAVAVAGVLAFNAPGMMTKTYQSPVSADETVARLEAKAKADGWKVLATRGLHKSVKEHTGKVVKPVWLVDLCHPEYAGKILENDDARLVSVFMPCTVAVYEKTDGTVWVTATNADLLGTLFGGVVKEMMAGPVAEAQAIFVDAAIAPAGTTPPAETPTETPESE